MRRALIKKIKRIRLGVNGESVVISFVSKDMILSIVLAMNRMLLTLASVAAQHYYIPYYFSKI